jgi:hypothetical protein
MKDAKYVVRPAGHAKVLKEKKKNVHAYVRGMAVDAKAERCMLPWSWDEIYYNPYSCSTFVIKEDSTPVESSQWVNIGVGGAFTGLPSILAFDIRTKQAA